MASTTIFVGISLSLNLVNHHHKSLVTTSGPATTSNFLGIPWVFTSSCSQLLVAWYLPSLKPRLKCAWQTLPAVILWTLWKERNARSSMVLPLLRKNFSIKPSGVGLGGYWLLADPKFKGLKINDLMTSCEGCMNVQWRKSKPMMKWEPPPHGISKFNVDGASRGKPVHQGLVVCFESIWEKLQLCSTSRSTS